MAAEGAAFHFCLSMVSFLSRAQAHPSTSCWPPSMSKVAAAVAGGAPADQGE
jgi:hypothetical protein